LLRVGLTGGIACGKSHVLRRLEAKGCAALDLDRISHELMARDAPAYAPVVAAFGEGILGKDRAIDRKALGALVFADPARRERLNAIVHPLVRREERRRAQALGERAAVIVTDAALLVEAGIHLRFDRLVVVHCAPDEQLRRLMARDSFSLREAEGRIGAQMPLALKRRFAHLEIDTSGRLEETDAAADALAERLVGLAREPAAPLPPSRGLLVSLVAGGDPPPLLERLLDDIASAGGLELPRVAALLGRRPGGAWLAADPAPGAPAPASLMAPVVAWCLSRRGGDEELVGLAAMSLARTLTPVDALVAQACATAWMMARSALGPDAPEARARAAAFARRWGGVPAPEVSWTRAASWPAKPRPALEAAIDRFVAALAGS
jgi:dephospho-CoA kinase